MHICRGSSLYILVLEKIICTSACLISVLHELRLACNNFVRLTFWCVLWLRTRTCGYLVMFYNCDLILFILWLVLVLVVVFEANPSLIFLDIYVCVCGCCLDIYFVGKLRQNLLCLCICVKLKWKLYAHM
jgi:hypothetical protein